MPIAMTAITANAPKSGSREQQRPHHQHHHEHRQEALAEARHVRGLAHRVVRGVEHHEELHELGGLHGDELQREPAPAAVHLAPDARHEHQREEADAEQEEVRRRLLPDPQRHLERQHPPR